MTQTSQGAVLWEPSKARINASGLHAFTDWVNNRYDARILNYHELWRWSVDDIARFWEAIWVHYGVQTSQPYTEVLGRRSMPGARWFAGARLNLAQHLLQQGDRGDPGRAAIFAESECFPSRQATWTELREQVAGLATYLRSAGVLPGDRVVAYLPISIEAVVGMLACISVGAVWSSCSPDFGAKSVLDRFQQISPRVLLAVTGYRYNGRSFDRSSEVKTIIDALPSLEHVIHVPWLDAEEPSPPNVPVTTKLIRWRQALNNGAKYADLRFEQVEFSQPAWILYTSGTTGMPKGIVHSQGGVLLEFIKFGHLHDDLKPNSVKFYYTSTGWTMFNLLVGGLATGCAIVLYDGCPTYPSKDTLWEISERCGVTYFGTSPTFVNGLIAAGYKPPAKFDLSSIRTVAMTGSPASPDNFAWFYEHVGTDLHVFSMSGGTDVATAFVGQVSTLPVRAGEIQAPCLGVDAQAFDEHGRPVVGEDGELVICQPMPSMPICFWNDEGGTRYRESYFDMFPGVWRQGDLIRFNADGSSVISGRSDSTLNRYGIRIGTAEIYRIVESIEGIADSLIVNLELPGAAFFMPLFVVLKDGVELNERLLAKIKAALAEGASPRHVPDKVFAIEAVPYTLTGKKQEIPVKKVLLGQDPKKAFNPGACANPGAIQYFIALAGRLAASRDTRRPGTGISGESRE